MIFHKIKKIKPLKDLILLAEFDDDSIKKYDVKPLIKEIPVFEMLNYVNGLFEQVQVDAGGYGIFWNDDIDLECNEIYFNGDNIKKSENFVNQEGNFDMSEKKLFGISQLENFRASLDEKTLENLNLAVKKIVDVKKNNGKIMVVTGSGPNIHEGVTTLISELIRVGIIDAVSTSSAVIAHEMAGSLDRVYRVDAKALGMDMSKMPRGDVFEFNLMKENEFEILKKEMPIDFDLLSRGEKLPHQNEIIKAAGNMAYPMGLRTEKLAHEILSLARMYGLPFEKVAGWGCDERTMLGAADKKNIPVLVTIPQLVGGGAVGMSIGDSIPVSERSMRISRMLASCDVIIESAVALTQEIHDGPFECYTGHGIWAWWSGQATYDLRDKTLIRIDLDENLRKAVELNKTVQEAIDKGLPKTKAAKIPFRMEMSAFARHEGSLPLVGDIGKVWPLIAYEVSKELGIELEFLSASQDTKEGSLMREWIVENIKFLDREKMLSRSKNYIVK